MRLDTIGRVPLRPGVIGTAPHAIDDSGGVCYPQLLGQFWWNRVINPVPRSIGRAQHLRRSDPLGRQPFPRRKTRKRPPPGIW